MRRIPSGTTDQYLYFVAVDSSDLITRETGLSSFTVRRSRNGGASAAFTTPTINETDSSNMPGVYELLLDEDMTIDSGDDSQEVCLHITHAGMAPVTLVYELYRPKITAGYTLGVESDGDLTKVNTLDGHTAQTGDSYSRIGAAGAGLTAVPWNASWDAEVQSEVADGLAAYDPPTRTELSSDIASLAQYIDTEVAAILEDTGTTIPGLLAALESHGDGAWVTATGFSTHSAADVWSVATRVLTAGTNIALDKGTGVTGFNDLSAAQVNAEVDTALADYDGPTNAEMEARTLAAANYATATALQTVDDEIATVDSNIDAIKTKTDSLAFTVSGQVDANIKSVAGGTVTGAGSEADPWGP